MRGRPRRDWLPRAAVLVGATVLVVLPWVAFNLSRYEEPVFMSTNDGTTILGANCDLTYGIGEDDHALGGWQVSCIDAIRENEDPSERSARQRDQAVEYVRDHLDRVPVVVGARLLRTLDLFRLGDQLIIDRGEERHEWSAWTGIVMFWVLAPLGFVGWRRLRGSARLILAAPALCVLTTSVLFYGSHRLRAPAEPAIVLCAAVALAQWAPLRRLVARVAPAVGAAGVLAACGSSVSPDATPVETSRPAVDVPLRIHYGSEPSQFADLLVPATQTGGRPVVVLVHGGFWGAAYGLDLMEPLARDLAGRGYAVWNIEYRRVGEPGGGWPGTLQDVAAAIDHLASIADDHSLDLARVGFVGHSAGGHLALWAAGRDQLPATAPVGPPAFVPVVAVGQGAVVDLAAADAAGLGGGAVGRFLGGSAAAVPERYDVATPRPGGGVRLVSVRGGRDAIVPPAFSVLAGIETVDVDGDDHFDLIDPASESWAAVVAVLDSALG